MKIVLIGGVPRSLLNFRGPLLRALVDRGHEVIACATNADDDIQKQLNDWGVAYRDVPIRRAGLSPLQDLATLRHLVRFFRESQPDVVLGYTIKPVIWGLLAARITGVPKKFAMIEGLGYAFMTGGSRRQRVVQSAASALYRVALKDVDGVFFLNPDDEAEFWQRQLLRGDARSIRINGIGVDLSHFSPQPMPKQPIFLMMARLIADKGIREYREAARVLRERYPQARFMLAGAVDENPAAIGEAELKQWQTEGEIEYLGSLDDVRPALAECAVYVLPSYYREGVPRTILEAMATGRPVITTDAPGCRETVENEVNGYLVPPRDAAVLAVAMERLVDDADLRNRMGKESLRLAREKYDVHRVNRVILEEMAL